MPITEIPERPWQLEQINFPGPAKMQAARKTRGLNKEENGPHGSSNVLQDVCLPPTASTRCGKSNTAVPNSLPVGIIEGNESNTNDIMDDDVAVMNGEDVVMQDSVSVQSEAETIRLIPNDAPLQFGDHNTFIAAWNDKAILAIGYLFPMIINNLL